MSTAEITVQEPNPMQEAAMMEQVKALILSSGVNPDLFVTRLQREMQPQRVTAELFRQYIDFLDVSKSTATTYTRALEQFAKWIQARNIDQPSRKDILAFRDDLARTHKPTTVQTYIVAVRLFFRWTYQEGLYPNIADHVKGAKVSNEHKRDALTARQTAKVLDGAKRKAFRSGAPEDWRDYAILTLLANNGLRTIEISRANIEDLRATDGEMRLYVQGKGKDERSDFVRIEPETEDVIRAYLEERVGASGKEPLFISYSDRNRGARLVTRTISGIAKTAIRAAGYDSERLTAHSLRHTFCTEAAKRCKREDVQKAARHSKMETTEIYIHDNELRGNPCSRAVIDAISQWRE